MDKIDILYATNKKYLFVTLASLVSLMENANLALDTKININLMTEGLVKEDYKLLEEIISLYPAFKLTVYPIEEFNIEKYNIPKWLNTQVANARLFFQEILGDKVKNMEKILYLDSDTIVIDDLRGLEKYQGGIYAVKDSALPSYCRKLNVDNYYNSGVLYLDPKNWIENNYQEKIVDFVKYNRDFDFLLTAWNKIETDNHQLIIISDTYKPKQKLPNNVILKNDIIGEEQFPWIANAELVIIPIKDGTICSGDTVLLNSMMLKKTTVVTTPSTLQEMYIQNGYNGITIEKDPVVFSRQVSELLINNEKREKIGKQARESFLKNFSRFAMGQFFAQVCAKNFNQQYDDK